MAVKTVEEAEGLLKQLRKAVEAAEKFTGAKTYIGDSRGARAEGHGGASEESRRGGGDLILGRDYDSLPSTAWFEF